MSRRKRLYDTYLLSGHWKSLRRQAFERDNWMCRHCGTKSGLRGHHVRYRKDLRQCTVEDILTLCAHCHDAEHKRIKKERKANRKPRMDWLVRLILDF